MDKQNKLQPGIYEKVISKVVNEELSNIDEARKAVKNIDKAEAPKILADYLANIIRKRLEELEENQDDVSQQVELVNSVIDKVANGSANEDFFKECSVVENDKKADQLFAILEEMSPLLAAGKKASDLKRPETSLSQSSLFTGADREPQMVSELRKEIVSSDRIDMLVSFIRWSGLRLIIDDLKQFTNNGGKLRVIATTYMGATDEKAITELSKLTNTDIKISYNSKSSRLHAKAYMFYRNTGFDTAYIGSSNLSNPALTSGLEWNLKITAQDQSDTLKKINATFESYWNSSDFEPYTNTEENRKKLCEALKQGKLKQDKSVNSNITSVYTGFDFKPYPYQQDVLDKLEAERIVHNSFKNLVVAATGTGKTMIAAFDYKRYCKEHQGKKPNLLFIAHRKEILEQSLNTFRQILKDFNFGELYVDGNRPSNMDYVFASVQSLCSQNIAENLPKDHFDFIIVDESHHATASSYQSIYSYFEPKILLGMTATPERMDACNILEFYNNRIAAEIRLPEAINKKILCPFQYFGITDTINLENITWKNGGYDKAELTTLYTENNGAQERADMIVRSILEKVTDINKVKGLGFCVTIKHAEFMADYFNKAGISSIALSAGSSSEIRNTAKNKLINGEYKFIFTVDLYNEGVDIPDVNTVLFLRPTESITVFLQQLGRGLRLADDKECLTCLDFVGQANKKYNFEGRYKALLSRTDGSIENEIKKGFVNLPKGCSIQLDKVASDYILQNIKDNLNNIKGIKNKIQDYREEYDKYPDLEEFLNYTNINPEVLYSQQKYSFYEICQELQGCTAVPELASEAIKKSMIKFLSCDSRKFLTFLIEQLPTLSASIDITALTENQKRMLRMFYVTVWNKIDDLNTLEAKKNLDDFANSPNLRNELLTILKYKQDKIDFVYKDIDLGYDCPLELYGTYTRDQILMALGDTSINLQSGVKYMSNIKTDIFLITLNKSEKDYSPTTCYKDYSVNEKLFHWQSQNNTRADSETGQRYINHEKSKNKILFFVREAKSRNGKVMPYSFLGTARYVSHKGEMPMNILWEMDYPIPARFLKQTNKFLA